MTNTTAMPALVGEGLVVPLVGGGSAPYVNFDFAASAPALVAVRDEVEAFLPWYSSVHRGAGFKSLVSTKAYEQARLDVASFVGARDDDVVIFTRNTTDSINCLASCLPEDCRVVTFDGEHHANLLPWRRRHRVQHLPVPDDASQLVPTLDAALSAMADGTTLVSFTAVSNVTGEIWPVAELAACAKRHGAKVMVDTAQLSPHAPVTVAQWDVDWVVLSGHKLYAPHGAGALVGRSDWLCEGEPFLAGGGAVAFVTHDEVVWAELPDRQEAGSPNVVGAVALGTACRTLQAVGMDNVLAHEQEIDRLLRAGLDTVPGMDRHNLWGDDHPRIAVQTFNLAEHHHSLVASVLSAEYGIAVRDGCFCAHPLMLHLLHVPEDRAAQIRAEVIAGSHVNVPGSVRASAGLSTTPEHVDALVEALQRFATHGARWGYVRDEVSGNFSPDADDRAMPSLSCLGIE